MAYANQVSLKDKYGWVVEGTRMDELRVVNPTRLVGAVFDGAVLDANFWTATLGTVGSATLANDAQCVLLTGTTANNTVSLQTVRIGRYIGGSHMRFRTIMRLSDTGTTDNIRRWGAFTTTGGAFFELNGTTLNVCTAKTNLSTSAANIGDTGVYRVAAANWTTTFAMDTNVHTYEIYWTNSKVDFVIDGVLRHTINALLNTWADSMHKPVRYESNNSNGVSTSLGLRIRVGTIYRLGELHTENIYGRVTNADKILKYGPGCIHTVTVCSNAGTSISFYDGLTAGGVLLGTFVTTALIALTVDIPFFTGLFASPSGTVDVTVVYE